MSKRKQKIEPWHIRDKRKRSKQIFSPRKRYLICTEGKSEAIYFAHYKSSTGPVVIPLDKSDHKLSLVKKVIEERNSRIQAGEFDEEIDEAWVVLDRDANPSNRLDKSHFNQALNLAERNGVFAAYSNDAFELWFILHYQDLWANTHRDHLFKMLSRHRGKKYEKTEDLYGEIKPFRPKAMQRAASLLQPKHCPESSNPSTTVHHLVAKLINEPGFREED
jgi:hypothetical protein